MDKSIGSTNGYTFFDRDLSWLSFNERVLMEAEGEAVPVMERIRFLSIYSSNLDEFYRVRVPAIAALKRLAPIGRERKAYSDTLQRIHETVVRQQKHFGDVIESQILPLLRRHAIHLVYNEAMPAVIHDAIWHYFMYTVATYIQIVPIEEGTHFFSENNKLYLLVSTRTRKQAIRNYIVTIPSDSVSRFYRIAQGDTTYLVFLDDIVKFNLSQILKDEEVLSCHSFKITRDSELNLEDEFTGNLAKKIENKIAERDYGLATRFLFEPGISPKVLNMLKNCLDLEDASFIQGGVYHNLKDLASLPLHDAAFQYGAWPRTELAIPAGTSLFETIRQRDILLHPPYHTYDAVLRFFNEASLDPSVKTIYVTLYRVANDSRIASALISAARNGKKVIVFVELKARFDEANNIKWSKKMRAAGVRIIESIPGLKVHAKLALVKRKQGSKTDLLGLIATGNFNESTARYYTDHVLMTSNEAMLAEVESLFNFLKKRKKRTKKDRIDFRHLLVGHFNLQERFIALIDREISNAQQGLPSGITIKFNNLEDKVLIEKLYQASQAGVRITMIVRGICCLVPGVKGMSETISVTRIIDRYLEHGRIFIFENNGDREIYLGSADWMNRNIYRRIEVCFPVYDAGLKAEVLEIVKLQLADNTQAVTIDEYCTNCKPARRAGEEDVRSQLAIAQMIKQKASGA
ncbi:MAG TPA: polyphosphate kinase 1 [Ohtaekwangia sp.]|uniref:polyphosphate kinase 1 n=1 Tax=Ohtaekwangia sp. TaxID=2066019 RepID=UPI002F935B2E